MCCLVFYQHPDQNKGIESIEYNHLNLPQKIVFSQNREIHFAYTAEGQKLSKTLYVDNEKIATRYYAAGMEYRNDTLDFVIQPEGRVLVLPGDTLRYEYSIRDHLGDTRITFSDLDHDGLIKAGNGEIIQESHYDPWGMELTGIWQKQWDTLHPTAYLYNNKEFNEDFGLNWSDYGARLYDATDGRWWVVDPLAEKSRRWSPYCYGLDNPVRLIDPDGNSATDIIVKPKRNDEKGYSVRILEELKKLTDDDLAYEEDGKTIKILKRIDGGKKQEGTKLIRSLVDAKNKTTGDNLTTIITNDTYKPKDAEGKPIDLTQTAYTEPTDPTAAKDSKEGSGSTIYIDPEYNPNLPLQEGGKQKTANYIALSHELIHSDNNAEGNNQGSIFITDQRIKTKEELNTFKRENIIRAEQHFKPRYTGDF